jgi:hypothetical protein
VGVAVSAYPFHDGVALFLLRWVACFRRECVLWKDDRKASLECDVSTETVV